MRARVNTPQELGSALREFRKSRQLTQRELATELGVSQRYISELEQGKPGVFTDRLFGVFQILAVRMSLEQQDI